MNNIQTLGSSHSAPCRNNLLVALMWCVFLMKCPIFTWITCHRFFFSFILCKPSNRSQLKVKIFHCLFYCHWNTTLDKQPTAFCGRHVGVKIVQSTWHTQQILGQGKTCRIRRCLSLLQDCSTASRAAALRLSKVWSSSAWLQLGRACESGLAFEG